MKKFMTFVLIVFFLSLMHMALVQAQADTLEMISLEPGASSANPQFLTVTDNYLFFTTRTNFKLFRTDGTTDGTVALTQGSEKIRLAPMINYNGILFFAGAIPYNEGYELCKSDGTIAGTVRVKNINTEPDPVYHYLEKGSNPGSFAVYNGLLYFSALNTDGDVELFKTDGTEAGTTQITRLHGITGPNRQRPHITGLNYFILFNSNAHVGELHGELYQYVPNLGYAMVKDIRPGLEPSSPSHLITLNGWTFFNADDGVHGRELWKTNGTEAGTQMVKDITPGPEGTSFGEVIIYKNLLFFTAQDNDGLWRSDGTGGTFGVKGGTYRIARTVPDWYEVSSDIKYLTIHDDYLYFSAYDGNDRELWRTDGTAIGTEKLTSFPHHSTDPESITSCNGRLFLTGYYHSATGRELLEYKPAEGVIELVENIRRPGYEGSEPTHLTCHKNKLFFSADNGVDGRELWVLTMPTPYTPLPGPLMLLLDAD